MNTLDIAHTLCLQPKKTASTHGGEYASACPVCGGNDRFHVWPNRGEYGSWWCRGCGKGGDAIALLQYVKGLSYKEACEYLGKAMSIRRSRTPIVPKAQAADFIPATIAAPAELWQAKAAAFIEHSHKALLANADQLAWLAQRGITKETAVKYKLGWNPKNIWRKRSAWGVEDKLMKNADGSEKLMNLLCLCVGLIIPYIAGGHVHRLRIRRPEGDVRYYVVPGSDMSLMSIPSAAASTKGKVAWVIVESELDAILVAQDAGYIVGAAALGAVTIKPDDELKKLLDAAVFIMVSLDADVPASKAWPWWSKHFAQAERWPVPQGKDPGDYRKAGGDIRAWVLAGLPPGLRPVAQPVIPPQKNTMTASTRPAPPAPAKPWTLIKSEVLGECIVLANSEAVVSKAKAAHPGLAVYAPDEIARLKPHFENPDYKETLSIINRIKKILGGKLLDWKEAQ